MTIKRDNGTPTENIRKQQYELQYEIHNRNLSGFLLRTHTAVFSTEPLIRQKKESKFNWLHATNFEKNARQK